MDNPFYFTLTRISTAQILRAAGHDRTRPSTLDILTDILIRYLHLLGTTSMSLATHAGRSESTIRDVRLAMEQIGVIAPGRLVSRKRVRRIVAARKRQQDEGEWTNGEEEEDEDPDGEDESDESTESLERLVNWFKGAQAAECRRVAGEAGSGVMNGIAAGFMGENGNTTLVAEYITSITLSLDEELTCF